jgi:mannose-6-phosphate isomerase-like protein (cupin superfamily)
MHAWCSFIKKIHEKDFKYRNNDISGVKYLLRGPSIDWGLILLRPGEYMADKEHGHEFVDETFYFMQGDGVMIINRKEYEAPQGSVFLVEPSEMHNIRNDSTDSIKIIFIKGDYKPDDKI